MCDFLLIKQGSNKIDAYEINKNVFIYLLAYFFS